MRLEFWGAARDVTGSMHLLEVGGRRLLLDCGLYQGRRKDAFERNRRLPFDARSIDAVILSHAHIDHSGNLPSLVRAGFAGAIHATSATRDLSAYMLMDAAHIQESDVAYVNKIRRREGRRPFEPLYTQEDAQKTLRLFVTSELHRAFEPVAGVRATFLEAGHMLGSAIVVLDLVEEGRARRLVFSGDLGARGLPILRDPEIPEGAEILLMESTYGDRGHPPPEESIERLAEIVLDAHRRRGKLLIPAFAVGRTQEILYRLNLLHGAGRLPPISVFIDSPLAINVTDVFRLHPECYDAAALALLREESDRDPLSFPGLRYSRTTEESKRLSARGGPVVVLSASGMCESGRILHHLRHGIGDERNTILFVGFQAEHTLGRKILDGNKRVSILGQDHEVRARVVKIEGYSAHADRPGLLHWARQTANVGRLSRVYLVHGEESAMLALAGGLREIGVEKVEIPRRGSAFEI